MSIFGKLYSLVSEELWIRTFGRSKLKKIKSLLKKNQVSSVLEVGCAEGYITRNLILKKIILKGIGIDIRESKVQKAKLRSQKEKIQNKVLFKLGDAIKLSFKDKSFDAVILPDVLEHLTSRENVKKAIEEAYRVAKSTVIITIPRIDFLIDYWIIFEPDHFRCLYKYHNFWLYKEKTFDSFLDKLNFRYEKKGKDGIVAFYIIKKN